MGTLQEASENIKRLSAMFKGLVEASDEIDKMGSLEGHVVELELAKAKLLKEQEELSKQNNEAVNAISSNAALAEKVLEDAKASAAKIVADAQVSQAMLERKASRDKAAFEIEIGKIKADLESGIERARAELEILQVQVKEKSEKLEEINAALEKIKGGI